LNVISSRGEKGKGRQYSCIALNALTDPSTEGGIKVPEELKKRIHKKGGFGQCIELAFLNLLESR
jgi:hypothetical protein